MRTTCVVTREPVCGKEENCLFTGCILFKQVKRGSEKIGVGGKKHKKTNT